jgi:hypothetical protein
MLIVSPHIDTHGNKLADPISLPEQLIDMWIHIKDILKFRSITRSYQLVIIVADYTLGGDTKILRG